MRVFARSKIHLATVTKADLNYVGSITIDSDLLKKANIWPGEKVLVASLNSGARLETYVIEGEAGSVDIFMNGAAAHLVKEGEVVIIIAFEISDEPVETTFILVDEENKFVRYL